jgi:hypothetical protein
MQKNTHAAAAGPTSGGAAPNTAHSLIQGTTLPVLVRHIVRHAVSDPTRTYHLLFHFLLPLLHLWLQLLHNCCGPAVAWLKLQHLQHNNA